MTYSGFRRLLLVAALLFLPLSASGELIFGDLTLVSKARSGRSTYDYTYKAAVTNSGAAVTNATATVTSTSAGTTIIEGDLTFGDVGAGATVTSSDTFTIRQDRRTPFDPGALTWTITLASAPEQLLSEISSQIGPTGGAVSLGSFATVTIPVNPLRPLLDLQVSSVIAPDKTARLEGETLGAGPSPALYP